MNLGKVAFASLLIAGPLSAQVRVPFADTTAASAGGYVSNYDDPNAGNEAPIDVENAFVPATDSIEVTPAGAQAPTLDASSASVVSDSTVSDGIPATDASVRSVSSVLGGNIGGFLTLDKSPYRVEENLVLPEGRALVINAGVVLEFAEGTGIDIRGGSIAVLGEDGSPVVFRPKTEGGSWNGISVTGGKRSEFQGVQIHGAEYGIAVESGTVELRNSIIDSCSGAAVYAKNGTVVINWSNIVDNRGAGVWASERSSVTIDDSKLERNHIAVVAGEHASVFMQVSAITNNEFAIVADGDNLIAPSRSRIEDNGVGFTSKDLPSDDVKKVLKNNKLNVGRNVKIALSSLKPEPSNLYAHEFARMQSQGDGADSSWKVNGSVHLTMGGHGVITEENEEKVPFVYGADTVAPGKNYKNYFQTPGFFVNWNTYLQMESPYGQVLEFSMDAAHDAWDKFNIRNIQASYTDNYQKIILGDIHVAANETYLAGVDILGASYEVNMFHNVAGEPLFVLSGFGGEANKPLVVGDRNPDMYNDYVEDGEAEVQKIVAGGKIRWNMHRRFNGTLGFVGSKDFWEDPIMRDGPAEGTSLAVPAFSSKTFFADGNWLFFPGDIELNGQVAFGGADTLNVLAQRAINKVFAEANLNASNFAQLRRLMKNPILVNDLSEKELEKIFGDNSMMTVSEMRKKLISVLELAKQEMNNSEEESDEEYKDDWSGQNLAVAASYHWTNGKTSIEGYFRFVGNRFYSAGSPDLLQNSRLLGGNFEKNFRDFWIFNFGYELNVENASGPGDAYNIFGLAEGAKCGLIPGADKNWLEDHEQDANRTLYNHDGYVTNKLVGQKVEFVFRYAFNYRTRSTNQRLYANYAANSGIFDDDWFAKRKGKKSIKIVSDGDTVSVDSARWAKYYALADEKYLATQFEERLLKNTFELGLTFKLPKNVLKIGGIWTFRTDLSKFEQDDLLEPFDFSDKTYGILGYYFHGGDYFEQRYPVSLTTSADNGFRNVFSVVPRYKIYNRDDMSELEWTLMENMTIPISPKFVELSLSVGYRRYSLSRTENGKNADELEFDFDGSMALRFQHTKIFSTEWLFGTIVNSRPDNPSEAYTDIYGSFSAKVDF